MMASNAALLRFGPTMAEDDMSTLSIDKRVLDDNWSDLSRLQDKPQINRERLYSYRRERLRQQLKLHDADFCILVNPISLRYAVDYPSYMLFQSHIPTVYLFLPQEGPTVLCGYTYDVPQVDDSRPGRPHAFFEGGTNIDEEALLD